jgi:cobalt/nickel transport system permease protein
MHIHFLDPYRSGRSPIHHLDARVKFILTLAFILTAAMLPVGVWPVYILLFSLALSVVILSELGLGYVYKRSALALPFVLAALPLIFTLPGRSLWTTTLFGWTLSVSQAGVERFASIALKSWLSVQMAIVMAASTPFPDLLVAMRAIHIPRLLVAIFGLMWRYLFVFADETLRLIRARAARSGQAEGADLKTGGSLAWRGRVAGGMAGNLFLRAFDRSDRIYMAMLSRGYDGEVRSMPMTPIQLVGWAVLVSGLLLLVGLLGLAFLLTG